MRVIHRQKLSLNLPLPHTITLGGQLRKVIHFIPSPPSYAILEISPLNDYTYQYEVLALEIGSKIPSGSIFVGAVQSGSALPPVLIYLRCTDDD